MIINVKTTVSFLLLLSALAFGGGRVSDTTHSSAKIGDILTNPDNIDKLDGIISGVATGIAIGKHINENGGFRATWGELKSSTPESRKEKVEQYKEGLGVKYKNSKSYFFTFVNKTRDFLLDVLNTASDRIDMWRTTLPNIKAWGASTRRLVDNTRKVYSSFKWKDLWDIDREWSRQMERVNMRWINQYHGFMGYLWSLGDVSVEKRFARKANYIYQWRADSLRADAREKNRLKQIQEKIDLEDFLEMEALSEKGRALLFKRLPIEAQETAIIGLSHVFDIMANDSAQTAVLEELQRNVSNRDITYLNSMELLANIKLRRTDMETQRATLQQIQSNMATMYARLQMMEMEEKAAAQGRNTEELKRILNMNRASGEELTWEANRGIDWSKRESAVSSNSN